jgi:hypothetical protein
LAEKEVLSVENHKAWKEDLPSLFCETIKKEAKEISPFLVE